MKTNLISRRLRWGAVVCLVMLVGVGLLYFRTRSTEPTIVVVKISTNGIPRLWGVPLRTQHLRDLTFRALHASGLPVNVAFPAVDYDPSTPAGTNLLETLNAIGRSKLLRPHPLPDE